VTRAVDSPSREEPLALALVDYDADLQGAVQVASDVPATVEPFPFVAGSDTSARIPSYES
jgi:aminomethyltransferase